MSQSSNVNTGDNAIDPERVYCTSAVIKKVGRAVAVSLEDATLPGNAKNKHMTILYRGSPKWSDEEIQSIQNETTKWIIDNNGSDQAPVMFTIHSWGRKSMTIQGDLQQLCLYLRQRFTALSVDEQRIPHVELFVGKVAKERGRAENGGMKVCHICGASDHYKKRCPMKDRKSRKHCKRGRGGSLRNLMGMGGRRGRHGRHGKHGRYASDQTPTAYEAEKVQMKLVKIMSRIQAQKEKKLQEIALLDSKETQIAALLANMDQLDSQTVHEQLRDIAQSFKRKRKCLLKSRKGMRKRKNRRCKQEKKEMKVLMKQIRRQEKGIRREEKKKAKQERKTAKHEMKVKLQSARVDVLPPAGDHSTLFIHVDGYNLIGCDAECRKGMRGKRGGMRRSRQRLARLLQEQFMDKVSAMNLGYDVQLTLWFDGGKGQTEKYGDIQIAFSSKDQIVDDKLVQMFSGNGTSSNLLVVTSDRNLTLRLHDVGVMVMKSGRFYKQYLKVKDQKQDNGVEKMEVDGDEEKPLVDDQKQQNEETGDEEITDDFVHVITGKVVCGQNDDKEFTPEGNGGDNDDETDDYSPDEVEGGNHEYSSSLDQDAEDGEDSDYFEIFGDEEEVESE